MNPQHTVPTLKDGDFVLNESRAMQMYLCDKYGGADCKLYPKDPCVRAKVNDKLFFDATTLYAGFGATVYPTMSKEKPFESSAGRLAEVLGFANEALKETGYLAGTKHLTIADIAMVAGLGTAELMDHVDLKPHPEVVAWLARMKKEIKKYDEINVKGAEIFAGIFNPMLK